MQSVIRLGPLPFLTVSILDNRAGGMPVGVSMASIAPGRFLRIFKEKKKKPPKKKNISLLILSFLSLPRFDHFLLSLIRNYKIQRRE
jgi:hypothetical protein